jgi:glycosyltransferase involved in cell wall biosynthesis
MTHHGATGDVHRPRLLVVASTFPRTETDGTPRFVADLTKQEAKAFDTLVLVPRVKGAERRQMQDGYRIERFAYFPSRWEDVADGAILENVRHRPTRAIQVPSMVVAEAMALRRSIRSFKPDLLHVHWIVPQGIAALMVARGRPWVVTTLGGDLYALTSWPWRLVKRAVLKRATAVTVMNRDMADRIMQLGVPAHRIHVQPMGFALRPVAAGDDAGIAGRIMFVGRLVEKKGASVLLDALMGLPLSVEWSLDVVGDGPLRKELETRARPADGRVRFLGQVSNEDLVQMWQHAALAVFPSVRAKSGDQDGLPVALLEAMSAGRAVVASALPGIDEAITSGKDGILVPPGDPIELRTAIARLLADPDERERLGTAARERAASYTIDAVGERYRALLTSVLASTSASSGDAPDDRGRSAVSAQ